MSERKNVIVVMFDTLQFNYLGCYGNPWIKTPNLDFFASQGVLFENAYTEGLPTIPCRRSMLTATFTETVRGDSSGLIARQDALLQGSFPNYVRLPKMTL